MEISRWEQWTEFKGIYCRNRTEGGCVHSTAVGISVESQNIHRDDTFWSFLDGHLLINMYKVTLHQNSTTKSITALFVVKRSQLINQHDYRTGASMDTLKCSQPKFTAEKRCDCKRAQDADIFKAYKAKQCPNRETQTSMIIWTDNKTVYFKTSRWQWK